MAIKASASISLTRVNDADSINIGGRNLIVQKNVISGWVNGSGVIDPSGPYKASDFIPVKPGETCILQVWPTSSTSIWIDDTYFKTDKTYLTGYNGEYISSDHVVKKYTVPAGAAFMRVSYTFAEGYRVKLEKGNRPTDWSPAPEDIQNDIDNAVNDSKVEITNAYNSAIDQTSKQLQLLVQNVETITKGNSSTITELSNQLQITSETAQFVKTTTEKLQNAIDGKLSSEEIREWARFDGATLELGTSNSQFKCKLSNTELAFYQGENKVAWISNNELHILTAIIAKSIGCGNFTFVDEGALGFSLI